MKAKRQRNDENEVPKLNIRLGRTKKRALIQVAAPNEEIRGAFQAVIDEAGGYQYSSLHMLLRTHRTHNNGMGPNMIIFHWAMRPFPNVVFLQDCEDIRNSEDDLGIVGTQMLTMVESLQMWNKPRFQGWTPIQKLSEFHKMLNMFPVDISPRLQLGQGHLTSQQVNSMNFIYRSKDFHLFAAKAVARMTGSTENRTALGNPECRVVGCTHEASKGIGGYCGKKACMDSLICPYCGDLPWMGKGKNGTVFTVAYPRLADRSCQSCRKKGMHKNA